MPMNVRTLCLSILYRGETTGYNIRKMSMEGECSYFVDASYSSIYPALAKLESEGLLTSRVEQQTGKPAKKIYMITELGRRAFINALFDSLGDDQYRSEFLLFARFASELPASLVEQRIKERISAIERQLADLEDAGVDHDRPDDVWVLNYGRTMLGIAHDYLCTHMDELIALARPDVGQAAAAE